MKGQQQAFSAVLITAVLIGVVSSVYLWGVPLIQKSQDRFVLENAENLMRSINSKVREVANSGGREQIDIDVPGIMNFDGDVLTLSFQTEETLYTPKQWIQLTSGDCDETIEGNWETDNPDVLCVKSSVIGSERYATEYRLTYRKLVSGSKSYLINLEGSPSRGGKGHILSIEDGGTVQDGSLISTLININII